jgi:PTH2 family peptidyl-tRNA hydrolase
MNVKQAIIMRKDLKMRRGKEIAQGSHASMAFLVKTLSFFSVHEPDDINVAKVTLSNAAKAWLAGRFTKVCLQVNSEAELMEIHDAAVRNGLTVSLITDAGATEFHGTPTRTCIAIGPDEAERIDLITENLKLY